MEKLIYARWASRVEIDAFLDGIKTRNEKEYRKSISYLEHHKEEIFLQYDILKANYERIRHEISANISLATEAYHKGTCMCGGKVRYIESHDFYGCENYKDSNVMHKNWVDKDYTEEDFNLSMKDMGYLRTDDWVTVLKNKLNLPKSVRLISIFRFLKENDRYCLNAINGGESVELTLNNHRDAIKKGVDFEHEIKSKLEKKYKNLYYHQAIKYQYQQRPQLYAIPDFIAVDVDRITIYECKLHEDLKDDRQRQKYIDLVSFIMREKNMSQEIRFIYVYKRKGKITFSYD